VVTMADRRRAVARNGLMITMATGSAQRSTEAKKT
jgi:hypothetical protein